MHKKTFYKKNISIRKVLYKDSVIKVLTNEKRGGLKVVAFDRSPFKLGCPSKLVSIRNNRNSNRNQKFVSVVSVLYQNREFRCFDWTETNRRATETAEIVWQRACFGIFSQNLWLFRFVLVCFETVCFGSIQQHIFPFPFLLLLLAPGPGMNKNKDPESGMNIPDGLRSRPKINTVKLQCS